MPYHIDERDLERQRLLARLLNPFTVPHPKRLAPDGPCRWLDLGFGVGETTGMLARGGMTQARFDDLMDEFRRVEEDPAVVLLANPIVSVWTVV